MRRASRLRFAVLAGVALAGASCLSPTLPLPPPDQPDTIRNSGAGTWVISGSVTPGALVEVFDETLGKGVIVQDHGSGRYDVTLTANKCDLGWIRIQVGQESSEASTFVIQARSPSDSTSGPCR